MSSRVRKAVIPAAGLGTRFLPATKAQPKEMLTIVDKPAIQYVVEEAVAAGIDDILIVTGTAKKALEDHFDRNFELETLLERNPRLLFGAISGYGNGGEGADWPAFDYSAYWARTGLMDMMRDAGTPPSLQRPAVGDHAAAVNLVCGLLAAMRLRDATGAGQHDDVSLLQTGFHILGTDVAYALALREPAKRHDRSRAPNPPVSTSLLLVPHHF